MKVEEKKSVFILYKQKIHCLYIFFLIFVSTLQARTDTISVFDKVLFFDGYASLVSDSVYNAYAIDSLPPALVRHENSLYSRKLTNEELSFLGDTITIEVLINASCDNYDRIGNVNLALVPKGEATYNPENVERYELGRFITPFMDKNKSPNEVPYLFDVSYLKHVFKERHLLESYDFWIELEVFGVPYAANTQIAGCNGRSDVFFGTLNFITSDPPIEEESGNVLIPLLFKHILNNYEALATDEVGKTQKTVNFTLEEDLINTKLVLITSNHGANAGGEEYNRRWHYVYFDNSLVLTYKPGRTSCEPFRKYNTQLNGIYNSYPAPYSDALWQSFSNWCPGDVIDTRIIKLGDLSAGNHSFRIEVPDAVFYGNDGYFPISLYFLSTLTEDLSKINIYRIKDIVKLFPNPTRGNIRISSENNYFIENIVLYDISGRKLKTPPISDENIDVSEFPSGVYWLEIKTSNGYIQTKKIIKQ